MNRECKQKGVILHSRKPILLEMRGYFSRPLFIYFLSLFFSVLANKCLQGGLEKRLVRERTPKWRDYQMRTHLSNITTEQWRWIIGTFVRDLPPHLLATELVGELSEKKTTSLSIKSNTYNIYPIWKGLAYVLFFRIESSLLQIVIWNNRCPFSSQPPFPSPPPSPSLFSQIGRTNGGNKAAVDAIGRSPLKENSSWPYWSKASSRIVWE